MRMLLHHLFPAPEGTPTNFCTKPNPDAANFSLYSPHLFRTATTILQDDLKSVSHHPTLRTQGAFAQNPLTKKLPISLFPRPHTSGKFSIFLAETSIATSTFFLSASQ
jgi:hypothetical protein